MPADSEYGTASHGGLKLKGVKSSRVDKHKKKHKSEKKVKKERQAEESSKKDATERKVESPEAAEGSPSRQSDRDESTEHHSDGRPKTPPAISKTKAEQRYDELRRRRLDDRLRREGVKSHKERVEDLNRYLSSLSEHHDMPRIGPG